MIVVDESIVRQKLLDEISRWYPGKVSSINALRLHSVIKDESIPSLLMQANKPTFVTINVKDFWRRSRAHQNYCIVGLDLPKERIYEVPALLRQVLKMPAFSTKPSRMGKVIRLRGGKVLYYERDGVVQAIN